jgi:hypothetical protein
MLHRLLTKYGRITYPILLGALIAFIALNVYLFSIGGSFLLFMAYAMASVGLYRALRGSMPPLWTMILLVTIPVFAWGFYVIRPDWYMEWRESPYFWWMIVGVTTIAWLSAYPSHGVARSARKAIATLLIVAIGIGAYHKFEEWMHPKPGGDAQASAETGAAPQTPEVTEHSWDLKVTKEWQTIDVIALVRLLKSPVSLGWVPLSASSYEIQTSDDKIWSFPAKAQDAIHIESPLLPAFKVRAVDVDTIDMIFTAKRR